MLEKNVKLKMYNMIKITKVKSDTKEFTKGMEYLLNINGNLLFFTEAALIELNNKIYKNIQNKITHERTN